MRREMLASALGIAIGALATFGGMLGGVALFSAASSALSRQYAISPGLYPVAFLAFALFLLLGGVPGIVLGYTIAARIRKRL